MISRTSAETTTAIVNPTSAQFMPRLHHRIAQDLHIKWARRFTELFTPLTSANLTEHNWQKATVPPVIALHSR